MRHANCKFLRIRVNHLTTLNDKETGMRKPVVADSEKNLKSTMVNKARLCFAVWRGHFVPELLLCSTLSFDSPLSMS